MVLPTLYVAVCEDRAETFQLVLFCLYIVPAQVRLIRFQPLVQRKALIWDSRGRIDLNQRRFCQGILWETVFAGIRFMVLYL